MKNIYNLTLVMLKIWSQPVLDAWVNVFKELVMVLPYNLIEDETNKIILYLSDSSQPAVSRYIAGRMIGFVADVRKDKIKGTLFERSRILCLDHDIEVRKVMAKEIIYKICLNLTSDSIEMHLLDKVLQLVYDSEINVKCAGIELIFNITPFLSPDEQKNRMCKIFMELLSSPKEDIQIKMSSMIGQIFNQLAQYLNKNQSNIQTIVSTFKEYGSSKNPKLRTNFAHNFPAILKLADPKSTFDKLKNDCKEVRYKLVSSFHEVTGLVIPDDLQKHLLPILKDLIKDQDSAIINRLIQNIDVTIKNFVKCENLKKDDQDDQHEEQKSTTTIRKKSHSMGQIKQFQYLFTIFNECIKQMRKAYKSLNLRVIKIIKQAEDSYLNMLLQFYMEQDEKHSWRIKALFLEKIQNCIEIFNMNKFYKQFIPMIMQNLRQDTNDVRYQAAGVLVKFICSNHYINKTKELFNEMLTQFYKSQSYQQRISFIYFTEQATQNFSRDYFKKNKLFCVLELFSDKIPDVRLKLAKAMTKIRYMLNYDDDDSDDIIEKFDKTLNKLQNKKDKEVCIQADKAAKEIDDIDFDSDDICKQIEKWDEQRKKNEERLIVLEQKEREENNKSDKDDFDFIYKSELQGSNFAHNYKKRYSARYNMSPSLTCQPHPKSKLSVNSHNTNSLTSLNKASHSSTTIQTAGNHPPTSTYNSSSLRKETHSNSAIIPSSLGAKKAGKRSSFEQKTPTQLPTSSSITSGSGTKTTASSLSGTKTSYGHQSSNSSDFKPSSITAATSALTKGAASTSTIKKKL